MTELCVYQVKDGKIISHDMISPIRFMGYLAKKMKQGIRNTEPAYQTRVTINFPLLNT
jgi:hypothetical protein